MPIFKAPLIKALITSSTMLSFSALADDILTNHRSFTGFTGLINTPNAQVLEQGMMDFSYNNQLDLRARTYLDGHNFIFSAGLFEGFEASGLIASSSMHDNLFYKEGEGQTRDLSFNAKYQIPYIPKDWFSVAIGARDLGGAANNYSTYYLSASKQWHNFRLSAGVSKSDTETGQMNGPFAGIEWQVLPWLSLQAEHDAEAVNAAARITIPKELLYNLGTFTLTSRFYSNSDFAEQESFWGINFTMPFSEQNKKQYTKSAPVIAAVNHNENSTYNKNKRVYKSNYKTSKTVNGYSQKAILNNQSNTNKPNVETKLLNTQIRKLKKALLLDGFENIRVAFTRKADVFVEFENPIFNRNDIDAIGLVIGRITEYFDNNSQFNVQLSKQEIPLLTLKGSIKEYKTFIENGIMPKLSIEQGKGKKPTGLVWVGNRANNSPYFKPRVTIGPALSATYATEMGVYDYSLALRADVHIPLWQGAGINVRAQTRVAETEDFEQNKPFYNRKVQNGIDQAVIYQTVDLPFNIYNQTQFGLYREYYDYYGLINETAWQSETGRHAINAKLAYFEYKNYLHDRDYHTLSYRYNWSEKNVSFHATAGKFWEEDKGYKLESRFWFGDSYVSLFMSDTEVQQAGIAFSIPLTPRKDMKVTKYGQVTGNKAWRHKVSTRIGESHNQLLNKAAYVTDTAINLNRTFFNQGRLSSSYVNSNMARLKEAYLSYK